MAQHSLCDILYRMSVFFFDLDGTLWDEHCRIPESTKYALDALHQAGHLLFICSGRTKGFLNVPGLGSLPFDGGVYGCGTHVQYQNRDLLCTALLPEQTRRIVDCCSTYGVLPILEGPEYMYVHHALLGYDEVKRNVSQYREPVQPVMQDAAAMNVQKATCIHTPDGGTERFNRELSAEFTVISRSGLSEIIPAPYSKASGMQLILDVLNIDRSDSYAFGDSENDLSMLGHAGHGIAMGGSPAAVHSAAEFVTDSVKNDGIRNAVTRLGFIH